MLFTPTPNGPTCGAAGPAVVSKTTGLPGLTADAAWAAAAAGDGAPAEAAVWAAAAAWAAAGENADHRPRLRLPELCFGAGKIDTAGRLAYNREFKGL